MKFVKKGSDFSWEVLKFMKKVVILVGRCWNSQKKVVKRLGVLDMVVEKCSFYEVFLEVVFKKHVNYNEKVTFRNIRKKKKNELIASELYSLEKFVWEYKYMGGGVAWDGEDEGGRQKHWF